MPPAALVRGTMGHIVELLMRDRFTARHGSSGAVWSTDDRMPKRSTVLLFPWARDLFQIIYLEDEVDKSTDPV